MIYGIEKYHANEHIQFIRIDDRTVHKKYFNNNGVLKKLKKIDIKNTEEFMLYKICHDKYREIN